MPVGQGGGDVFLGQVGIKYFALWDPHLLGQYFARDRVIYGLAGAL